MRKRLFAEICLSAFFAVAVHAQLATTTSLVGTVTDSSGKVIPGAKVTATETGTLDKYTATTNGQGYYTIEFVRVGVYSITVEQSGFQKVTKTGIIVDINQTVRTDITLPVGAVSQSVTVEATVYRDQDRRRHRVGDPRHAQRRRAAAEWPRPHEPGDHDSRRAPGNQVFRHRHAARRGFQRRRNARDPEQHVARRHQHHEQPDHHHARAADGRVRFRKSRSRPAPTRPNTAPISACTST